MATATKSGMIFSPIGSQQNSDMKAIGVDPTINNRIADKLVVTSLNPDLIATDKLAAKMLSENPTALARQTHRI